MGSTNSSGKFIFIDEARIAFQKENGDVDWDKVRQRWNFLKREKESLAGKYFTPEVEAKARTLSKEDQSRLLDVMMGGLCNPDSSVGVYATRPEDYDNFNFYLEPLIRDYHKIEGDTKQVHDWNIPVGKYLLKELNPDLDKVSMRARVARNVRGWNLPPSMNKDERLRFEAKMESVFSQFTILGKYHSLTPGHKNELSKAEAEEMITNHFLFNDMTTDNHLTSSGVANDWPYGRGIWLSEDKTKMIWVGEEDQLRIISIVQGNDLGVVDDSLRTLLTQIEKAGIEFAEHPVYGVITTCPTNMGTGKRQSILGQFPNISKKGTDEKALKELAKTFGLQARGMGGEHSAMDAKGTADISPSARFGVTEAVVANRLYEGLKKLYGVEMAVQSNNWDELAFGNIVFLDQARKIFLDAQGNVDWSKVYRRWEHLRQIKESLAAKFFTQAVYEKAKAIPQEDQQRLLDIMMGGLCNEDSSVGVYATRPEDYDDFSFYLEPLIRAYHKIEGDTKQVHDWDIPLGKYLLQECNPALENVSMRARVARNVKGWNLPPSMDKEERLRFERTMEAVFARFDFPGKYYSLTPGHPNQISEEQAEQMRKDHFLFNDMTTDNHLTSSGVSNDWPHGRGIWMSNDKTKMIWVGEEDQLRIISIMHGSDLGIVDDSLRSLLTQMSKAGVVFAEHPVYGVITTCPTNMGTGKRQSILGQFPNISKRGTDEKALKELAKTFGLQARGMGGEHSAMDENGTADISPSARFGVTEAAVASRLFEGLKKLYSFELNQKDGSADINNILKHGNIVYIGSARKLFLDPSGNVDWNRVQERWQYLKKIKESLAAKFFTQQVYEKAKTIPQVDQQRLLDIMMGGLCNDDSSVGVYATRPEDYDNFSFYLEPLIRTYHNIEGDTKQVHDWDIPVGKYLLQECNPAIEQVSMRARVARNVKGWNLPPSMDKEERLRFEAAMEAVFSKFDIAGKYHSLTPGHKNELSKAEAEQMITSHFLFNDMTTDNHLTSSGVANDWPYGRGIWLSDDKTKMIWVGEEDQLRIISIVQGNDLGIVDDSLRNLLNQMEKSGVEFAEHPVYGVITTCPTNMGTGKRQSILGQFPNISKKGTDEKALKELAKTFGLQARGMGGEHSAMDENGTADISPSARFGVTEAVVANRLYEGLKKLYAVELAQ